MIEFLLQEGVDFKADALMTKRIMGSFSPGGASSPIFESLPRTIRVKLTHGFLKIAESAGDSTMAVALTDYICKEDPTSSLTACSSARVGEDPKLAAADLELAGADIPDDQDQAWPQNMDIGSDDGLNVVLADRSFSNKVAPASNSDLEESNAPVETKTLPPPPPVEAEASNPSLSKEAEDGAPPPMETEASAPPPAVETKASEPPPPVETKASAPLAVAGKSARSSALYRNESVGREKAPVQFINVVALVAATAVAGFFIYSTMKPRLAWRQK
jgi:hypothetical protein